MAKRYVDKVEIDMTSKWAAINGLLGMVNHNANVQGNLLKRFEKLKRLTGCGFILLGVAGLIQCYQIDKLNDRISELEAREELKEEDILEEE